MDNELGELSVRIVGAENVGRSHTLYTVQCSAGVARWEVRKRFSDFVQLHTTLQTRQKVTAALPPKRMFGKMTDAVIKLRQEGLEEYLHAVLRDLESEQVRMLYTFLQLPASLMGGLAAGHDLSLQPDNGHLGAEELGGEQQIGEDASFREIVDNVSDLMIDVFQTPLPVSSSELKARRNQYRAMLETCEFPLENDEDLAAHLLRIIGPVAAPEPHDAAALLKAKSAHLAENARQKVVDELDFGSVPLSAQRAVSGSQDSLVQGGA